MKIRSITYFLVPGQPLDKEKLARAGRFARSARPAFQQASYEVQTLRLATIPFPLLFQGLSHAQVIRAARKLEAAAAENGFTYISLGPALVDMLDSYDLVPDLIEATQNTFCSGQMTSGEGVSLPAVRACANIIQRIAPLDANGFANLYFTALANVPAGTPFFPAAYHGASAPAFAIATEAADLAVKAFSKARSVEQAMQKLVTAIDKHSHKLQKVGNELARQNGLIFSGIDFSLAPFPSGTCSLGGAIEKLGVPEAGLHGSLTAAALLTGALDQVEFKRVGFSGLFTPQLEDSVLARRAAEGSLTVKDLLLYSAVCGSGLDTIPLPGDTTAEQLTPLLLDLAALALRLDKPLTARLMPVPGKKAGDLTSFDFEYFANSRVMALDAQPLKGPLAGDETICIHKRNNQ
jgi:uncharacterized protein (UPF0210 family)